ncbi:MAG TPA: hypothetical protein VNF47_25655 [Streptosporangiaceae bacterium]|nr:hypothetical protein [Streptosporangiaceae bacterium]
MSHHATTADTLREAATRHHRITERLTELLLADDPADIWLYLDTVLGDIPALAGMISRQGTDLAAARLHRANLAAAALAVLAATREGEPDPMAYLRDELLAQGHDTGSSRSGR